MKFTLTIHDQRPAPSYNYREPKTETYLRVNAVDIEANAATVARMLRAVADDLSGDAR